MINPIKRLEEAFEGDLIPFHPESRIILPEEHTSVEPPKGEYERFQRANIAKYVPGVTPTDEELDTYYKQALKNSQLKN